LYILYLYFTIRKRSDFLTGYTNNLKCNIMSEQNSLQSNDPTKSSKNIWSIIIVIVILIVGGSIYALQKSNLKQIQQYWQEQITLLRDQINQIKEEKLEQEDQVISIEDSDQVNKNEEENLWQEYENDTLGIKFKYPQGWFIRESETKNNKRIYIENQINKGYDLSNYPEDFLVVFIEYWEPSPDIMSYERIMESMSKAYPSKDRVEVDSIYIDLYESKYNVYSEGHRGPRLRAYWQNNGLVYSVDNPDMGQRNNKEEIDVLRDVLYSLKFTK